LNQAELFGEYVVDFKYILIDINRYSEKELWEEADLIGGVFLLDQNVTPEIYCHLTDAQYGAEKLSL
jgi:hypothetical protein